MGKIHKVHEFTVGHFYPSNYVGIMCSRWNVGWPATREWRRVTCKRCLKKRKTK